MEKFLSYISAIQPLEPTAIAVVREVFRPLDLKKGDFFAVEGEYSARLGFVLEGVLRAYYQSPSGQQYNKSLFVGPGFFGALSSLISGRRNQIFIQALTPCRVLTVPYTELKALYDEYHSIERLARRVVEQIFIEKEQREIDLVTLDATARYIKLQTSHPGLEQQIPQYQVASYLGISPTQLSRIRAELAKQG
jgi:CRP-like cAMP-binding protein